MNFNLYLFGNPKRKYSQYPQDYTKEIIEPLCSDLRESRGIIYRHMDLQHYIYIEDLGDSQYFGICLIFNKLQARNPLVFIDWIKGYIENEILGKGRFINYDTDGNIIFNSPDIASEAKFYDRVKSQINSSLDSTNNFGFEIIQSIYNGSNHTEYLAADSPQQTVFNISQKCNRVIIEHLSGINSNPTHNIITNLQAQIATKNNNIADLTSQVTRLEQQKKQYRNVVLLCFMVLLSSIGLYFLYNSLNKTTYSLQKTTAELNSARDTIGLQRRDLEAKSAQIWTLRDSLFSESSRRERIESELNELQSSLSFVITSTTFNFGSRNYICHYRSERSGYETFRIKVFKESNNTCILNKQVEPYVSKGISSFSVYLNCSMNSSEWYTIEVWKGNTLIGGSRH